MKNTKEKLKNQSKVIKASYTGSNITKYSGLNTIEKYMNHQNIVRSLSSSFPAVWHNATKFGVNHVLKAIALASISGINRIHRIAAFSGDGLVKAVHASGLPGKYFSGQTAGSATRQNPGNVPEH